MHAKKLFAASVYAKEPSHKASSNRFIGNHGKAESGVQLITAIPASVNGWVVVLNFSINIPYPSPLLIPLGCSPKKCDLPCNPAHVEAEQDDALCAHQHGNV